jgi:hypothetical protein
VLRARFLRHLQIEDDDDHEHDLAIRALPRYHSRRRGRASYSISLPPADRGRPRARHAIRTSSPLSSSWSSFVLDFFATTAEPRMTTTTSTIWQFAPLTRYRRRSRPSCSISSPPADRGRRRPRARSGDSRLFPIKTQRGDASHPRSRFRCHPWSRCPPEKRYSFDDPKRNDGATPSASRLTGSPGPLLAGPQGRVSTKRRT